MRGSTEAVHSHSALPWKPPVSINGNQGRITRGAEVERMERYICLKFLCLSSVQVKGAGLTAHGKHNMVPRATQHESSRVQEEPSPGSSAY